MCVIASPGNCSTTYVSSQWLAWTAVDFGTPLVNWPIGGGVVSVPSSAIIDLGFYPQAVISITGTATITSFGPSLQAGRAKLISFTSTATLVNSSNLILPGGINITTQTGDSALVLALNSGVAQVMYQPARTSTSAPPNQQKVTSGGTSTITIVWGDVLVNVAALATLTLPASGPITVTDDGGNAGANPITVVPPSGNICSSMGGCGPSFAIANPYGSARFVYDGTNYIASGG
jgi:hypothetical protein